MDVDVMKPETPHDAKPTFPCDIDIEQTVLAAILQYYGKASEILPGLEPEDFYSEQHQAIFRAMRDVAQKHGTSVEPAMVSAELKRRDIDNRCGGLAYLRAVQESYVRLNDISQMKRKLRELRLLREAMEVGKALYDRCQHSAEDPLETLSSLRMRIDELIAASLANAGSLALTIEDLQKKYSELQWLWPRWIPKGQLTLLVAEPGVGKSALALHLAGCAFGKWPWPDDAPLEGAPGRTLYCDTEGNQRQLVERSRNWAVPSGALVVWPDEAGFDLQDSGCMERAQHLIKDRRCSLMVVDTLRGGFSGDENSSEVGRMLRPWAEMAQRTNVALLLVHHERKLRRGERGGDLNCVRGSSALAAAAKSVIRLAHLDRVDGRVSVEVTKSNYAATWPEKLVMTQQQDGLRFAADDRGAGAGSLQTERAQELLLSELAEGPRGATELLAMAADAGISEPTLQRAASELGVEKRREQSKGGRARSVWHPPAGVAAEGPARR